MKLKVLDITTNNSTSVVVADTIFAKDYNESLVHQVVSAYMAGGRSGTKAQKNRSSASGGGRKPHSQKGSGRARSGTIRSPIWRGGGVTFAANNRNYDKKVNKKMYRGAIRIIFSELIKANRLTVVKEINIDKPNTKAAVKLLQDLNLTDILIITENLDENLYLSARNLYHIGVISINDINPVSLIGYKNVVITKDALVKVEKWL